MSTIMARGMVIVWKGVLCIFYNLYVTSRSSLPAMECNYCEKTDTSITQKLILRIADLAPPPPHPHIHNLTKNGRIFRSVLDHITLTVIYVSGMVWTCCILFQNRIRTLQKMNTCTLKLKCSFDEIWKCRHLDIKFVTWLHRKLALFHNFRCSQWHFRFSAPCCATIGQHRFGSLSVLA